MWPLIKSFIKLEGQETYVHKPHKMNAAKIFSKLTNWTGQHEEDGSDDDDDDKFVKVF